MIKTKKKVSALISALGITLVAALAFSGLAAGSAQAASWHVKALPYSGYGEIATNTQSSFAFRLKMEIPSLNVKVACDAISVGSINESTKMKGTTWVRPCTAYDLKKGTALPCVEKSFEWNDRFFTFEGTGASVTTGSNTFQIEYESGKGCPIPLKPIVTLPSSLSFSYGPESTFLEVTGTGAGQYGAQSMTATLSNTWMLGGLGGGVPPWGWY